MIRENSIEEMARVIAKADDTCRAHTIAAMLYANGYRKNVIDTKVLKKAIATFGPEMQLNVAIEEFSELTKEICKHKRGADNFSHIVEELADCYIMLEQMKIMFNLDLESTYINDAINNKIERLKQRLEKVRCGTE
jgi:NTP pyrophosphatase (non-canonical NTP hydrolase)